jgi:hypothetical protein
MHSSICGKSGVNKVLKINLRKTLIYVDSNPQVTLIKGTSETTRTT